MPIPGGGRYRYKKGTNVRLHFTPGGTVNEAKNMDSGATHTPEEFAKDKMRPLKPRKGRGGMLGY